MIKKRNQEKEQIIIDKLESLEQKINTNSDNNENIFKLFKETKIEYDSIIEEKINGMLVRARAKHIEHNEKNTKYFANLEKRHYESKTIHKLKINNIKFSDIKTIMNEQRSFYSNLYSNKKAIDTNTLNNSHFF